MILNLTFTIDTDNLPEEYQCDKSEGKDAILEVLQNVFDTLSEPLSYIPLKKMEVLAERSTGAITEDYYQRSLERIENDRRFWSEMFRKYTGVTGQFDDGSRFELKNKDIVYEC